MLYFITGNKNKFEEAKAILGEIKQLKMDLSEIQEINTRKIIEAKLIEALKYKEGQFIVEDTSLCMDCLGGLPGPLIRWFLETLGANGLAELAVRLKNQKAQAKTVVGYARSFDDIHFFEGSIKGKIVLPRGDQDWHWGPIFEPNGQTKTYGEMERGEKNQLSMRRVALNKLKEYLDSAG